MKLTRLRLLGFKSFVEPTDFLIEPGLTGVVGPNGCGKSNLVEALRWVMGETSYKSMRATDMDDVIFAGNTDRPQRNTAEVGMAIDNSDRTAPAQFNDTESIEVTRRIEREKGSTYRINGKEVRARDVQILFADASTGARSPALVHQGRIGEIIQAKPEQRRRVLEEAAGISGLHARRHEAELRLRAAEQNLTRLEDVIGQLAQQMDALKRQARQAVRYRTVSAQVRKAEATLFHLRYTAALKEVGDAEHAKDESVREVAARTLAQAEAAKAQAIAAAALPAMRDAEARAAAALQRLVIARETLDREEKRARERMAELDRRLVQLTDDIAREHRMSADADAALTKLAAERETLEQEASATAERRAGVDLRVAEADAALAATEKTFAELTAAVADLTAKKNQLTAAARSHEDRRRRLESEHASVTAELEKLMADAAAQVDIEGLAAAVAEAQDAVAEAEAMTLRAEAAQSGARQALDVARQPLTEAERRVNRLETEAKTLAKVLQVDIKNLWPPVIDLLTVEKGFETALGAALGDDLDAPIEPSAPIHWGGVAPAEDDPALPEGAEPLASHVSEAPAELARRLAQIGVVSRADGPRLAEQLRPGQRLVSTEGDLWRWDGFAVAANAPTGAARRLAERNRLADIEGELAVARAQLETRRATADQAEAELAAANAAEAEARTRGREAQRAANTARDRHAEAEREINRLTARRSALAEAQARLASGIAEAVAAQEEAVDALAELAPSDELDAQLGEVRTRVADERGKLAEVRAEAQALAREVELAERRLAAIALDNASWSERKEGAAAQIEALTVRSEEAAGERATLEEAPEAFEEKRLTLIDEIANAEAERRAAADTLASGENALADADRAARVALEAMGTAREDAARAEERFESSKRRLAEVGREIRETLEIEPSEAARIAEFEPDQSMPDISEVESNLDKLKRDRERLGAVNLRAEEELNEVETQHTSLVTERDDLVEAIKRLRQGIQSLNKEARERLLASFEVVNTHFQRLFTQLFGGGTAELQLTDSEDPLEAGLDILAKPPGKKPASLSLLSGGEQALTAMALIFAVFLTNPAPICVLDEVDAPLDDHNVDRFCDLLDEMKRSTDTRFVTITHNPITMARMNRLFGVTMAERGVSQLVSVDLENAVKILDQAVA
ncbi:chromosome segregation protein SMC [Xanthobacteraceae bacterium Astr-EGSB]|uniref:chromosome segregation protein SMC n=1 Tax=Astrobacterium formosum TaxID=3069710 RepID=UPI0027B3374C|nr:chromosome segregation protein SMC [Xanthobacteraceae bacterium Astr-EGSB]